MNKEHIIWLLRHIIPATNSDGDDLNGESVHAIRRHVLWMVEIRSKLMLKFQGPTHVLADGSFTISTYTLADIFLVLKLLVDEFAQTGEAIVKEVRIDENRNDDLITLVLATKTARTRTLLQDALPPQPPQLFSSHILTLFAIRFAHRS